MRSRNPALYVSILCVFAVAGCNPEKPTNPTGTAPASASATDGKTDATPKNEDTVSLDKIPFELKTEAFDYYGLSNTDEVKFEVTIKGKSPIQSGTKTGSQTFKLTELGEDQATFSVAFTGALPQNGEQELTLKKDGIFYTKMNGRDLAKPAMELPATLTQGTRWNWSIQLDASNGQTAKIDATFKVMGHEKIKTKAGEFDTVRVEGVSTTTVAKETFKSTLTGWYAKGTGQVKAYVKGLQGDPNGTMVQEIVK